MYGKTFDSNFSQSVNILCNFRTAKLSVENVYMYECEIWVALQHSVGQDLKMNSTLNCVFMKMVCQF